MLNQGRYDQLRDLALLYLIMAHRSDDYLSDVELGSITEKLSAYAAPLPWAQVQDIVMESLAQLSGQEDQDVLTERSALELRHRLTDDQKLTVLADLRHIARADGIVLKDERGLFDVLANTWGIDPSLEPLSQTLALGQEGGPGGGDHAWGVLHDLAYIYLHLAHATDHELSEGETKVMLDKLREWQPQYSEAQVRAVLTQAMDQYAEGGDEERFEEAVYAVRQYLPADQRMAALNDLIKIANADGVFLDNEEDLINRLMTAWEVEPYATYGGHGSK